MITMGLMSEWKAFAAYAIEYLGMPKEAMQFMKEDLANYLRNVLTDQYGWNIRNQVSHGLLGTDNFNFGMADRVVHAFLMLGVFKEKN